MTNDRNTALNLAYAALQEAPTRCQYHGTDYEKSGTWMGMPRCDSCKQPARVARALTAVKADLGITSLPTLSNGTVRPRAGG